MGGSDMIDHGTKPSSNLATIEVMTAPNAQQDGEWVAFLQELCGK